MGHAVSCSLHLLGLQQLARVEPAASEVLRVEIEASMETLVLQRAWDQDSSTLRSFPAHPDTTQVSSDASDGLQRSSSQIEASRRSPLPSVKILHIYIYTYISICTHVHICAQMYIHTYTYACTCV